MTSVVTNRTHLLAMSRLNLNPQDVLIFEDSAAGLKAAIEANCRCIIVRHPFNVRHDFSGAFCQINSFSDMPRTDHLTEFCKDN
jgi:beta-phosphoglucomutase-like phosphatase (HAD superfamily)